MTLYASDLDGTLLDTNAQLSATSAAMMRELTSRGALITFVTARTPATIEPILAPACPQLPGVAMTGAALWHPAKREYLQVTYHQATHVAAIVSICREHGVTPFVYTMPRGSNKLMVYHEAPALTPIERSFVSERVESDLKTFCLSHPVPADAETCTVLFFAMGKPEPIMQAAKAITDATGCNASWYPDTYTPDVALLEVFAPGVSKAQGVLDIKRMLGADRVVAFGDNLNDLPLLQAADVAVAVGNAHPRVKEAAHIVIGPNTAHSVMKFIADDFSKSHNQQ